MNAPIEIPVATDTPLYTQRITLEGIEFVFKFDWNDREARWYLGIYDINNVPLAVGLKIVANWPILRKFVDERLPPGVLIATDLSPMGGESPTYAELGNRVKLLYFPKVSSA